MKYQKQYGRGNRKVNRSIQRNSDDAIVNIEDHDENELKSKAAYDSRSYWHKFDAAAIQ